MKRFLIFTLISLLGITNVAHAETTGEDAGARVCGNTAEECSYIIDENDTMVISGNGAVDYTKLMFDSVTFANAKKIVIEEGITSVDNLRYINCLDDTNCLVINDEVSVYIPSTVTNLGPDALKSSKITNLTIAGEDTEIDSNVLSNLQRMGEKNDFTTIINCKKGSKTEERLKAVIGNYSGLSIDYIEAKKRTFYTPKEASEHVNHSNHNKIIFTFK